MQPQQQLSTFTTTRSETKNTKSRHRQPVIASGGRLPFSPLSFLEQSVQNKTTTLSTTTGTINHRRLDSKDENDEYSSYLVDKDGNAYEPYSLAWRYLGMYLDCDLDNDENENDNDDKERYLGSGSGDGDCERVLLWAAVRSCVGSPCLLLSVDWECLVDTTQN